MPSQERVNDLVSYVRDRRYVEAIEEFYAENASMQENLGALREGRDTLVQHEKNVLAAVKEMKTKEVGPVLVTGDRSVINWVFEMTMPDGKVRVLNELALQKWQGDRIVEERFYYDTASVGG